MFFFKKKDQINVPYESLTYALCVFIYVSAVATLMYNGNFIFGNNPGMLGMMAFLLLFVFSALIVGLLILGKPISLYLSGAKKEAIKLLLFIVGWMFLLLLVVFLLLLAIR